MEHPLRIGLSMTERIHTKNEDIAEMPELASTVTSMPAYTSKALVIDTSPIEKEISNIISHNGTTLMAITKSTPAPLTGGTLWCVTIALSLATFMQMLDSTISNVAIPTDLAFWEHQQTKAPGYHLVWRSKCHCDPCYRQAGTKNRRIKVIFTFSHFFFAVFL